MPTNGQKEARPKSPGFRTEKKRLLAALVHFVLFHHAALLDHGVVLHRSVMLHHPMMAFHHMLTVMLSGHRHGVTFAGLRHGGGLLSTLHLVVVLGKGDLSNGEGGDCRHPD